MYPTRSSPPADGQVERLIELGASATHALDARRQAQSLDVVHGTVWLTRTSTNIETRTGNPAGTGHDLASRDERDLWLHAGDCLELPRGSHWIAQAWPHARLQVQSQGQPLAASTSRQRRTSMPTATATAMPMAGGQLCAQGAGLGRS